MRPSRSVRSPGRHSFGQCRYRKLARTGKPANVVTAAIARELPGFVWVIARHVPPTVG